MSKQVACVRIFPDLRKAVAFAAESKLSPRSLPLFEGNAFQSFSYIKKQKNHSFPAGSLSAFENRSRKTTQNLGVATKEWRIT